MPRPPRSPAEAEAFRARILDEALALFADTGWEGFSMRKLGARLGIAAKTLYNYFASQDELYLGLLTHGFRQLHDELSAAGDRAVDPWARLDAMTAAYVEFGFAQPNLYNLMFIWHVPKFDDYVGTPSEEIALVELEAALSSQRLLAATVQECAGGTVPDEDLRFVSIRIWAQLHGYVAGVNNHIVGYMHPDPSRIRERMLGAVQRSAAAEVGALAGWDAGWPVPRPNSLAGLE